MRRMCASPGTGAREYFAHLCQLIERDGWAVTGLQRGRSHPQYAYTVGLTRHGRPELVVTGMRMDRAGELLNSVAAHVLHADPPEPGERIPLRGGPLIEVVEVGAPDAHLFDAVRLFGREVRALQLVHADDRGHWPWEPGWRGSRGGQPVLGSRATVAV